MQSSGGVHIAVATAKVSSWMGLIQTNGGVHMGTDTAAIATTQCEQALSDGTEHMAGFTRHILTRSNFVDIEFLFLI